MSRTLIFAGALVLAAALAVGWALSPGCEGRFCLGAEPAAEAERDRALAGDAAETDFGPAAGGARLSTEDPQAAAGEIEPLEEAAEAEPSPEALAEQGSAAAARETGGLAAGAGIATFDEPELTPAQRRARQAAEAEKAERWESLVDAALNEPDDELRGEAISGVALRRSAESVAVLSEVATFDPAPDNRLQAVQQLWYSAADGLDTDGGIRAILEAARDDPDEAIAEMAERALADLDALEERRQSN